MTTGLLVVDVQPAYHGSCGHIARSVAQRINNTRKPTVVMWVGNGLTSDDEEGVRDYLRAHGARPGQLGQCTFVEKDYAFFRGWMDNGVDRDDIIKVGAAMLNTPRAYSSEFLDLEELLGADVDLPADPLHRPGFDADRLLALDQVETCGGGSNECLAEIELWLEMNGKRYARLAHLVYG